MLWVAGAHPVAQTTVKSVACQAHTQHLSHALLQQQEHYCSLLRGSDGQCRKEFKASDQCSYRGLISPTDGTASIHDAQL
jgi:hypothetical protein